MILLRFESRKIKIYNLIKNMYICLKKKIFFDEILFAAAFQTMSPNQSGKYIGGGHGNLICSDSDLQLSYIIVNLNGRR